MVQWGPAGCSEQAAWEKTVQVQGGGGRGQAELRDWRGGA